MALQKDADYSGITCNYWKILNLSVDYVDGVTTALLGLYKDADTRTSDVSNIVTTHHVWASGLFETRDSMYPQCKASGAYLDGAQDC